MKRGLFSKYAAFALCIIALCLIQSGSCAKKGKSKQQNKKLRDSNNYGYASRNISSRGDMSSGDSAAYPPRDLTSIQLPNVGLPKPSSIVAYHRSIHNTSWAITIPLFTFLLPTTNTGDPLNIANQALYGFFAAVIIIIGFSIPILFNGQVPNARSLDNSRATLDHLIHPGRLVNLMGLNVGNQIGVDPMQCLQKTVCEAYRSPQNERYGMLAWPFQYFFPARNVSEAEAGAKSIYQLAAHDGKFTKTACGKKYECLFDVLDLASYCLSMYKRARNRVKSEMDKNFFNSESGSMNDLGNDKFSFR